MISNSIEDILSPLQIRSLDLAGFTIIPKPPKGADGALTFTDILVSTEALTGFTVTDLVGIDRAFPVTRARRIAVLAADHFAKIPTVEIGKALGGRSYHGIRSIVYKAREQIANGDKAMAEQALTIYRHAKGLTK